MIGELIAIAAGGSFGAILRYSLSKAGNRLFQGTFIPGTIIANGLGCLLIGIFFALFQYIEPDPKIKSFLITGLLGALTTLSTFSLEIFRMFLDKQIKEGLFYFSLSILIAFIGLSSGYFLIKQILTIAGSADKFIS